MKKEHLTAGSFKEASPSSAIADGPCIPTPSMAFTDAAGLVVSCAQARRLREVTIAHYRRGYQILCAKLGHSPVGLIDPDNVIQWLTVDSGYSRNTQRSLLTLFLMARRAAGAVDSSAICRLPQAERVQRTLTVEQSAALMRQLEAVGSPLIAYVALALFAGFRSGEIGRVFQSHREGSDLMRRDRESSVVYLPPRLPLERRNPCVEVHPSAAAWLEAYACRFSPGSYADPSACSRALRRFGVSAWVLRASYIAALYALEGPQGREWVQRLGISRPFTPLIGIYTREDAYRFFAICPTAPRGLRPEAS